MVIELEAVRIAAHDPERLAAFWGGLLGWSRRDGAADEVRLTPSDDTGFALRLVADDEPRLGPNQFHPDLTSTSPEDQRRTVARALALGASHLDVGQRPEEGHVVLADPEGNELCVIPAGNAFLEGCGFLGALAGDGSHATGCFWSAVLGWPLVWDEGEETAIQAPHGGPKLTWGGPPLQPRRGPERWRLDLVCPADDLAAEVDGLSALGASVVDLAESVLADPDGHEFSLRPRP